MQPFFSYFPPENNKIITNKVMRMDKTKMTAVVTPQTCAAAKAAGWRTLLPGWRFDGKTLYRPAADTRCDVLCACGGPDSLPDWFYAAIAGECKRVGANGVFLDFALTETQWKDAVPALLSAGLTVYAPHCKTAIPGVNWVCEPGGGSGFLESVAGLPETAAVFLRPLRKKTTVLRQSDSFQEDISAETLAHEIQEQKPGIYRSSKMQADYFTVSDNSRTLFYMFDTASTTREKAALLLSRGYGEVFVMWEMITQ